MAPASAAVDEKGATEDKSTTKRRRKEKKRKKKENTRKSQKSHSSSANGESTLLLPPEDKRAEADARGEADDAHVSAASAGSPEAANSACGKGAVSTSGAKNRKRPGDGNDPDATDPIDATGAVSDDGAAERRRMMKRRRRKERKSKKKRAGEEILSGFDLCQSQDKRKLDRTDEAEPSPSPPSRPTPTTVVRGPSGENGEARLVGSGSEKKKHGGSKSASMKGMAKTESTIATGGRRGNCGGATARPAHPFATDESDHCETPLAAYRDVAALLGKIASSLGKSRSSLVIYDPYYCAGGVKTKLASLGFRKVVNECRDFYADASRGAVPEHDVLLTNPPYSADHTEKLLRFATSGSCEKNSGNGGRSAGRTEFRRKPFLLLLPHFVYTKEYYRDVFPPSDEGTGRNPFYLVPRSRYAYVPPAWCSSEGSAALGRGKVDTAPFPSFWYCSVASAADRPLGGAAGTANGGGAADADARAWVAETYGPSGAFKPGGGGGGAGGAGLRYASRASHIPREFKGEFDPTKKRPNPRARKRMLAKKRKGAA